MKDHKHILINISNSPVAATLTETQAKEFLTTLVEKVDMEILVQPIAVHCDIPDNEGVTGVVVITTSHASFHAWESSREIKFDLYSCKTFNENDLINFIKEFFQTQNVYGLVIDRNNQMPIITRVF